MVLLMRLCGLLLQHQKCVLQILSYHAPRGDASAHCQKIQIKTSKLKRPKHHKVVIIMALYEGNCFIVINEGNRHKDFIDVLQGMNKENLLSKISLLLPTFNEIENGKVSLILPLYGFRVHDFYADY